MLVLGNTKMCNRVLKTNTKDEERLKAVPWEDKGDSSQQHQAGGVRA